jgi:hypothetical protein
MPIRDAWRTRERDRRFQWVTSATTAVCSALPSELQPRDRIRLTKTDQAAGGHHHSIPSSWIQSVDDKITVSKTADQAKQHWRDEDRNQGGALGWGDDDRGRTNLNRSFSGTY